MSHTPKFPEDPEEYILSSSIPKKCSDTETLRCKDVKYSTNDAWLAKNTLRYHEMTSTASHE